MPFWIFKKGEDHSIKLKEFENTLKTSFNQVRNDITNISEWITHLDSNRKNHEEHISGVIRSLEMIHQRLSILEGEIDTITSNQTAVQTAVVNKQTATDSHSKQVFAPVQTAVQTVKLGDVLTKNLTPMERAIVSVLINSDMKLTYDDLSIAIGRDKSTIRGQINNIKQKNENLINEVIETSGKKRFFVDDKINGEIFKQRNAIKVRLNNKNRE